MSAYWAYRRHEGIAQVYEGTAQAIRALPESRRAQLEFSLLPKLSSYFMFYVMMCLSMSHASLAMSNFEHFLLYVGIR